MKYAVENRIGSRYTAALQISDEDGLGRNFPGVACHGTGCDQVIFYNQMRLER